MDDTVISLLKDGGPWGAVVVCIMVILFLYRKTELLNRERLEDAKQSARDSHESINTFREALEIVKDWRRDDRGDHQ